MYRTIKVTPLKSFVCCYCFFLHHQSFIIHVLFNFMSPFYLCAFSVHIEVAPFFLHHLKVCSTCILFPFCENFYPMALHLSFHSSLFSFLLDLSILFNNGHVFNSQFDLMTFLVKKFFRFSISCHDLIWHQTERNSNFNFQWHNF